MRRTLTLLALFALLPALAVAQDVDPTGPIGAGALAYGLSELVKWAVPLIGSLLFSGFNKVQSAIGKLPDFAKAGVYVVLTTVLMYVGEWINVAVSNDPVNWTGTFWEGIAAGLVGTLLVKLGIKQVKDPVSASGNPD